MDERTEEDWNRMIDEALAASDPLLSNFLITRCHHLLSEALRAAIGPETGANFHSWAVWGSRKAGVTIRQEDRDQAARDATFVAGCVGGVVGLIVGGLTGQWTGLSLFVSLLVWITLGALTGGFCGYQLARYTRRAASRRILDGNRLVLDDIGRATACYLQYVRDSEANSDEANFASVLETIDEMSRKSRTENLLGRAFTQYESARVGADLDNRVEATYFGNCLAILHEHIRLQPLISQSLPFLIRKCVTERLMTFSVGEETLSVHEDVPPLDEAIFPPALRELTNPELLEFLTPPDGWDTGRSNLEQTRASDWTVLKERMGYIVNLFRTRQLESDVVAAPYDSQQFASIASGQYPARPW
ncbi:hypothetical protein [Thalassoglobus neptunius]|nr:hypothetical protein [Thalassoglobus neptunius]